LTACRAARGRTIAESDTTATTARDAALHAPRNEPERWKGTAAFS
jgi:hypothetical protein